MAIFRRKEVLLLFRLIVGGVFVYASIDKVLHPQQFAISVRAYQIVPVVISNVFALGLSWAELVSGTMLILGVFTRKAAAAVAVLLVMFIVALSVVLVKGMVIDCGCFKAEGGSSTGPILIVRNLVMLSAMLLVMRYDTGRLALFPANPAKS